MNIMLLVACVVAVDRDERFDAILVGFRLPDHTTSILPLVKGLDEDHELSDSQKRSLRHQADKAEKLLSDAYEKHLTDQPPLSDNYPEKLSGLARTSAHHDEATINELTTQLNDIRDYVADRVLTQEQMDELARLAFRRYGIRAIRFYEISKLFEITERQLDQIEVLIADARTTFNKTETETAEWLLLNELDLRIRKDPNISEAMRTKLFREIGEIRLNEFGHHIDPEKVAKAREKMIQDVLNGLEEILTQKQVEGIRDLFEEARTNSSPGNVSK